MIPPRSPPGLRPSPPPEFIGSGPRCEAQQRLICRVAASDCTVLLTGETGTGKEVVAARIHRLSPRAHHPFVVIDCGALQESLLQSELFGHEQGAFTGATRTSHGLFEVASGGTVFLDEIADVSPAVQAGLLRVLESSAFRRLGSAREIHVDLRLIAATHRNLEALIAKGSFREDLYFRLNTMQIDLRPLRERADELPGFVEHFLQQANARRGARQRVTAEAMAVLRGYAWPGNIRQLRHVIERASIVAEGETIDVADLGPELTAPPRPAEQSGERLATLAEVERRHLQRVLAACGGHRAITARILGISERNLYRKLHELEEARFDAPPTGR
ncbi:MAG: zraR 1 [Myxococcaceae bacterium]|nr:zraR 1 [Myxococcaceae bacterium]